MGALEQGKAVCPWCVHAEVREDVCGLYCGIGKKNPGGECGFFADYLEGKERGESVAFKTNVVKTQWRVITESGNRRMDYLVEAESEEAAKLKVPKGETVVDVECLDGR